MILRARVPVSHRLHSGLDALRAGSEPPSRAPLRRLRVAANQFPVELILDVNLLIEGEVVIYRPLPKEAEK